MEDARVIALAVTGITFHEDTIRSWYYKGRRGIKLPYVKERNLVLFRKTDLLAFLQTLQPSDPRDIALEDNAFAIPPAPSHETPEDTRNLDRLAIAKSRS